MACPGCYPTAVQLGLIPLLARQLVDPAHLIASTASGASGAGRQAKIDNLLSEASDNFKAYGVTGHRHLPEIEQGLADVAGQPVQESISKVNKQFAGRSRGYSKQAQYLDKEVQEQASYKKEALNYDAGNGFGSGAPANSGWSLASANIGQSNVSSLQAYQGSRILHLEGRNFATMGDEIVCTDAGSGNVLWKKPIKGDLVEAGGFLATPPITVGGKILIATLHGELILSDANTGEEIHRYETGEQIRYQPVVDAGRIYVSTMAGKMLCIDTGDASLTGWPTWGGNAAHTNR